MDRLEYVAQALLIYETLDAEQFIKAFNKELPLDVAMDKEDDKAITLDTEEVSDNNIDLTVDDVVVNEENNQEDNDK